MIYKNVVIDNQNRLLAFKVCLVCEEENPARQFGQHGPGQYRNQCKACYRQIARANEKKLIDQHLRQGIEEGASHKCARCEQTKTRKDFSMDRSKKTGVCSYCKICSAEKASKKYYDTKQNPEIQLLQNFGITMDQKQKLLEFQGSVCAVCGADTPQSRQPWSLDHCHATREIRGVLCHFCNIGLGVARDNKQVLLAMIEYLDNFPARKFFGEPKIMPKKVRKIPKRTLP